MIDGTRPDAKEPANKRIHVFDLHCDTLDRLALHDGPEWPEIVIHDAGIPVHRLSSLADNDASFSLNRAEGLEWCQCFAVFIPDTLAPDAAWQTFSKVRAYFEEQVRIHADRMTQVRDARDIDAVIASGRVAALLTVENGSFLDGTLDHIPDIAEAGVKMLTLTWNGPNAIGSGHDTDGNLTSFGCEAIRALERERIVVDVSHLNDRGFDRFIDVAGRPFAASHSNLRAVCGHRRNLTDSRFRAICDAHGLVGLNFSNGFLSADHDDPTPDDVLHHVDRFLELGGIDVLALGSDFDGTDTPSWLQTADRVSELHAVIAHGFGCDVAEKICFENARNFFIRNEYI